MFIFFSAEDPDPLDPQDFGFLDPDPQKYADPQVVYLEGFFTGSLALRYLSISKVKMRFNWNLVKGRHLLFDDDSSPYDS